GWWAPIERQFGACILGEGSAFVADSGKNVPQARRMEVPPMQRLPRLMTALAVLALSTSAKAQSFTYQDDDGSGRLVVKDVGAAEGVEGGREIRMTLTQGGRSFEGSGFTRKVTESAPATTLWAFTITAQGRTYFFQGTTR